MDKSDQYRRFARECLELARTALSEQSKAILLQMAQVWNRLADEHDRIADEARLGRFLSLLFAGQIPPSLGHFLQHQLVPRLLGLLNQAITLLGKLAILC